MALRLFPRLNFTRPIDRRHPKFNPSTDVDLTDEINAVVASVLPNLIGPVDARGAQHSLRRRASGGLEFFNGSAWEALGGAGSALDSEQVVQVQVNGVTSVTLQTPGAAVTGVYLNGLRLHPAEYAVTAQAVTFPPQALYPGDCVTIAVRH
ncbi:hypothetical protein [Deinococcus kurensis]|uniref:hypothetical protein n=1 Tax=Deinococcus kurensis TaxID=2662757 RepID=UPI0012D3559F|nr:hypothetical protein [Deinococcus kurensis]